MRHQSLRDAEVDAPRGDADASGIGCRVAMLVRNSCVHDTRVRKEAATLARLGYQVRVIAIAAGGAPAREVADGVEYVRVEHRPWRLHLVRDKYVQTQARARERYLRRSHRWRDHIVALNARSAGRVGVVANRQGLLVLRGTNRVRHRSLKQAWAIYRSGYRHAGPVLYHVEYERTVGPALAEFAPDIVHAHDLNTLYAAARYARRNRSHLVYDSHELELHRNTIWTRRSRLVARTVERYGIRCAALVVTVAPSIADELERMYRIPRPEVVLNSPPLSTREAPAVSLRGLAAVDANDRLLVYPGAVARGRGHDVLIEALALLPSHFHVAFLGPRAPALEAPLLERAQARNVAGRVHLLDALPSHQVPAALRTADAAVIPLQKICRSYDFALPNKLFDAVMAGVPLGVGCCQEMRQFVELHQLGLVFDEREPAAVAAALEQLVESEPPGLADPDRLSRLQTSISWEAQEHALGLRYEHLRHSLNGHR